MPILSPALGVTVPDSPHATVVCLPTLADVESYERKEERVWKLLHAGYPRFVRNALVTRAAQEAARNAPPPSPEPAQPAAPQAAP